ncbi:hypothetical protein LZ554_005498 [Drepanopeziza brunnea f. sp. 'monogermtubi']|nr:hypothetical protein LZ554_005498 [Drepanopeziza brunnea f. sp. 'monogermtubi']
MEGFRPRPIGSPSRAIMVPHISTAGSSPILNSPSMSSAAPNPLQHASSQSQSQLQNPTSPTTTAPASYAYKLSVTLALL